MAEERIFVEKVEKASFPLCVACWTDGEDYFCSWGGQDEPTNKEICEKKCPYDHTISRQEAIERMAKAICSKWGTSGCKSCAFKGDGSMCQDFIDEKKSLAEAALNALLEGKK